MLLHEVITEFQWSRNEKNYSGPVLSTNCLFSGNSFNLPANYFIITEAPQATLPPAVVEEVISIPTIDLPPASALLPGPVTMVALGDSLTQGDGDDTGRGYTLRLLDRVNTIRPGSAMTNFGQSGWNSDALINGDQGLTGQLTRSLEELEIAAAEGRPAVALVWIGSNDLWYLYEFGEGTDENDALDAEHFASNLDVILGQLRGAGAQVIVALLDDQSKRPVALRKCFEIRF